MKKLLIPLVLASLLLCSLLCSCKDKAINYKDYDQSMSFDEAEKYVKELEKELKKEKREPSVESDGSKVWRGKKGNVCKQIKLSSDGIKETIYFDEDGNYKFYTDSSGFKKWYDYDEHGRIIYERENYKYRYPEIFYEYVESKRFTVKKEIIPARPSEMWYRRKWKDTFSAEDVLIYEKYKNSEIWHMHNPLVVTKMREAYSENLDKENCLKVSFGKSKKIMEKLQDDSNYSGNQKLQEVFFKTKCHFSRADEKNDDWYWFFSDGKLVEGFDASPYDSQEYYFPIDMPSFTPIELYYHYSVYFDEDSGKYKVADYDTVIIDGWKVLDAVRFVGQKYYVAGDLYIRSEPDMRSDVIAQMDGGSREVNVLVLESSNSTAWIKIRTEDGVEGWCPAREITDGSYYKDKPWTSKN